MTEAGGTTTIKRLSTAGEVTTYQISNDSWDSTETITIPATETEITTSSIVVILGAIDEDTEDQLGDGELTVEYTKATRLFTPTLSAAAGDVMTIVFMVKQ